VSVFHSPVKIRSSVRGMVPGPLLAPFVYPPILTGDGDGDVIVSFSVSDVRIKLFLKTSASRLCAIKIYQF
jgi:hypothetical protein